MRGLNFNLRRRFSTTLEFFDSQSGQHVRILQGVQRHAVFRRKFVASPTSFATVQLGETTSAFEPILTGINGSVGKYFSAVESAGDVDKVRKLAKGVTLQVNGLAGFSKVKEVIVRARAEKLDCHCNLIDCFNFRDSQSTEKNALALSTLVGDLTDLDVGVILLHVDVDDASNEEGTRDALQIISDEVYGLDCVGVPLRARFGIYSANKGLEEWCQQELDSRNSLQIFD